MTKAMILAAGRGERMRPLTDATPKPLLPLAGKPLIVWTIERLASAGIRDLVINHAHLGGMIEQALGSGARWGVRIAYSPEREALETAGGIANALALLGSEPFLTVNGDIYFEYEFTALAATAARLSPPGSLAHLVLVPNPPHHPAGDFALEGEAVRGEGDSKLTFSGIGAYHPALFAAIVPGSKAQLAPLLREAMVKSRVTGERCDGKWTDVGTPARLAELEGELKGCWAS